MSLLKTLTLSLAVLTLSFVGTIVLHRALAFNNPSAPPPAGNVPLPLNTSPTTQTKQGPIGATQFQDTDNTLYFFKPSGLSKLGGTLDLSSNLIKNVQDPVDPQDVATKAYVDEKIGSIGRYDTIVERITRGFSWYSGVFTCKDGYRTIGWQRWLGCPSWTLSFNSQQGDQVIFLGSTELTCSWPWHSCSGSVQVYLDGQHLGDIYASRYAEPPFNYLTTSLIPGKHNLRLQAWDLTEYTGFNVMMTVLRVR